MILKYIGPTQILKGSIIRPGEISIFPPTRVGGVYDFPTGCVAQTTPCRHSLKVTRLPRYTLSTVREEKASYRRCSSMIKNLASGFLDELQLAS